MTTTVKMPEPAAWTLCETLEKRETTTTGHLWFSDPRNSAWASLFTAAQLQAYGDARMLEERERCAKVCEQTDDDGEGPDCWGWHAKDYAKAIRKGAEE